MLHRPNHNISDWRKWDIIHHALNCTCSWLRFLSSSSRFKGKHFFFLKHTYLSIRSCILFIIVFPQFMFFTACFVCGWRWRHNCFYHVKHDGWMDGCCLTVFYFMSCSQTAHHSVTENGPQREDDHWTVCEPSLDQCELSLCKLCL